MRIGLLTTSYPRFPGDPAGGFVAEHAAYLRRAGHDVEVLAAGPPGPAGARARPDDGNDGNHDNDGNAPRAIRVPCPPGLFDGAGAPEALAGSGRAYAAAAQFSIALTGEVMRRAGRWDAVVAHWLVPSAAAALIGARGLPLLAIAHSGDVHLLRRLRLTGAFGRLCSRPEVTLSFVTDELRRVFLARAPRCSAAVQVCSMGVDVARLRAARDEARRERAAEPPARPTVLFLGRLVPVKGVDVLVRAAARWRCGARLVIAGAGPLQASLRALAAAVAPGRVELVGPVFGAARDRALARADVVALPSVRVEGGRTEGMPLVALEALAAGAGLVASSVGGLAELPAEAVTRVAPGDAAALADAIDHLILKQSQSGSRTGVHDRVALAFDWVTIGPHLVPGGRTLVTPG